MTTSAIHTTGVIPSLDGVRALAVSLVFAAHAGLEHIVPGSLGVTAFFVLSGYLITTLMLQERSGSGRLDLPAFYLRRLLRLMPPLLVVLLATAALASAAVIDGEYSPGGFLSVLLYAGNYWVIANDFAGIPAGVGVTWSLAVEEHFYLIYPWLALALLRLPPARATLMLGGLCALMLAWRCLLYLNGVAEAHLIMATDTRADTILYGCILAIAANPLNRGAQPQVWRDRLLLAACLILLLGSLLLRAEWFRLTARYTVQGAAVAGLLWLAVSRPRDWPWRWLNARALAWLGAVSYSVYLSHHVILLALQKHLPQAPGLAIAALAAAITLAFAELMRRAVEAPCAQLRRRLHHRRAARNAATLATVTP